MNNNNQKLVPIIFLLAIIIFFGLIGYLIAPKVMEYQEKKNIIASKQEERAELEQKYNSIEAEQELFEKRMKNLKTIYETNVDSKVENTGKFGYLFDTIINHAQNIGLLIYSVEYELNPISDPIVAEKAGYNVCELKLILVGAYSQLRAFIERLNNLQNLIYISKMNVTAFPENTDYLLIKMSINLYSKKALGGARSDTPFQQN